MKRIFMIIIVTLLSVSVIYVTTNPNSTAYKVNVGRTENI